MAFAELAIGGIGKTGEFAVLEGEIAIGTHDFIAGEVRIVGGEDGLHVWKSADEFHNFARQVEMIVGIKFVEIEQGNVCEILVPVVEPFQGFCAAGGDFVEKEWSVFMIFDELFFSCVFVAANFFVRTSLPS